MQLFDPAPFNSSINPHRTTQADPYLEYPYDCCGLYDRWEYPCRGYLTSLSSSDGFLDSPEAAPTAEWQAGSSQTWTIAGLDDLGGNHYGGSCQVGFSTDQGTTFRVAASYEGDCPHRNNGIGPDGQSFPFTVPADLPAGVQVFAWIWYNREQELNMNCAAVNITSSISSGAYGRRIAKSVVPTANVAFDERPEMFVADDGNGCLTPHTTAELKYPQPGPDVVLGDGVYPLELPTGNCSGVGEQAYHGATGNAGHK